MEENVSTWLVAPIPVSMNTIPVIIPHFGHADRLEKCKYHLLGQENAPVEIFVRDNNHDNILYTAAINEGLRRFICADNVDYILVLNQDAYLDSGVLQSLVRFMEATPSCGIASPVHVSADRLTVTWGGGARVFPFGTHRCDPLTSYTSPLKTHWANGACMLIRRETILEAGFFDKNMRFICSDADFSFTARLRGWDIHVVPGPLCEHDIGSSNEGASDALTLIKLQDALYFGQKWLDGTVFRQLAAEGNTLSELEVQAQIRERKREILFLQQRIAIEQTQPRV